MPGPDRSLRWGACIERLVQIFLADEKRVTFNVWICASEDRGRERYWKERFLRREVQVEELAAGVIEMLDAARREVEGWMSEDLEPAGRFEG